MNSKLKITRMNSYVILGLLIYTAIFFMFYPSYVGVVDDTEYLDFAYVMRHGHVKFSQSELVKGPLNININNQNLSRYPPGNSALLIPFTFINWKLVFLRGYFLLIAIVLLFVFVLKMYNLPMEYSLLLLFSPPFILRSRTLDSDLVVALLYLIILILFLKRSDFYSGFVSGSGLFFRYTSILIIFPIILIMLMERNYKRALKYSLGSLIPITLFLLYNRLEYGNILGVLPYYYNSFSLGNFFENFTLYIIMLDIIFPFMLVLPFFIKLEYKWYYFSIIWVFILFHSFFFRIDYGSNFAETLVMGQRFMLPILPFLYLFYIKFFSRLRFQKLIFIS